MRSANNLLLAKSLLSPFRASGNVQTAVGEFRPQKWHPRKLNKEVENEDDVKEVAHFASNRQKVRAHLFQQLFS